MFFVLEMEGAGEKFQSIFQKGTVSGEARAGRLLGV